MTDNLNKAKGHDHEYKAVTYKVQVPIIKHFNYRDNLIGVTEEERVKIFCIKCGATKELSESGEDSEKNE